MSQKAAMAKRRQTRSARAKHLQHQKWVRKGQAK